MPEKPIIRIVNARVCGRDAVRGNLDVLICHGRIKIIPAGRKLSLPGESETIDARKQFLLPAFTDIHTHGAGLFDFTLGRFDPVTQSFELTPEIYQQGLSRYCLLAASSGVANVFAGIMACENNKLQLVCRQIRKYIDSGQAVETGSVLHGIFLEGVFINPAMAGTQNPGYLSEPDVELFERLNADRVIRIVNVVPDYDEKSTKLIEHLTRNGIIVGLGHTAATGRQISAAVKYGLKYCVHFANGPMSQSFKPFDGGGAIEGALTCPEIYLELLVDGYHVSPAYVRDIFARKGLDKVFASTDSMFVAHTETEEVTEFPFSGFSGEVSRNRDYIVAKGHPGYLFGSMLRMDVAFSNVLSLLTGKIPGIWYSEHPAMDFEEAVLASSRVCSANVNRMLQEHGHKDLETGVIVDGKWADLIIGDITGRAGNYKLNIDRVFVHGRESVVKHQGN